MKNVGLKCLWKVRYFLWVTACTLVLSQCVLAVNEEGQLLLSWKESLVDADNKLGNWDASDATPCLWNGVSCTQGLVSVIKFSNFLNLSGPMPAQMFGKFSNLTILDVGHSNLSGVFPQDIVNCSNLVTLNLSWSYIGGEVPGNISNLKHLEVLDLSFAFFNGTISNSIGELQELQALWLFRNFFEGPVPESISSMTKLQELTLGYNPWTGTFPSGIFDLPNLRLCWLGDDLLSYPLSNLSSWENMEDLRIHNATFPHGPFLTGVEKMTQLTYLQLASCNLTGPIPSYLQALTHLEVIRLDDNELSGDIPDIFGGMVNLTNLFVESNNLSGPLPASLWQCTNLTILFLFSNSFEGGIAGIGNFSGLTEVDISLNNFTGPIPPELGNLIYIQWLNFGWNDLSGEIPPGVADWEQIELFLLNNNQITGEIPYTLGTKSTIQRLDFSTNRLQGLIPPNLCRGNQLYYLSLKSNSLTGSIPKSYENCTSLTTLWLSNNQLDGPVPAGVWGLPLLMQIFLGNNYLNGSIDANIGKAQSLSWLYLYNNSFSGPIPPEIGNCNILTKFNASSNMLNGTLPYQVGNLTRLNDLLLGGNSFSGSIPPAIGECKDLVDLDLSSNNFEGAIPEQLANLTNLGILDLANNGLTGPIPSQFFSLVQLQTLDVAFNNLSGVIPKQGNGQTYVSVNFTGNPYLCMEGECNNSSTPAPASSVNGSASKGDIRKAWPVVVGVFGGVALVFVVMSFLIVRRYRSGLRNILHIPREDQTSWTVTSFTPKTYLDYEVTALDEDNLIGAGSSGKVYKVTLANGEFVAVKKLWDVKKEGRSPDHGFKNEVRTLGSIRHRHIVKLLCCCTNQDSNLLVYECMSNGSLGDLLHSAKAASLTWDIRYKIAVGAAMGLEYLHHDCKPRILHRDIKSNNILLDLDYEAHLGDFGISKVVETMVSRSSYTIAGSLGYMAPEYAFNTRVDEKSDVYSFGVVLLELVTGKRAIEPSVFGEETDLVGWVNNKVQTQEGLHEILDSNCAQSSLKDMIAFLRVAMLCTSFMPTSRPSMREAVALLLKAAPKYGNNEETLSIII